MAKITSKFQVTVPRAIADLYQIGPGDEIDWSPAGDAIRVTPARVPAHALDAAEKVRLFDQATERHRKRKTAARKVTGDRGWTRDDMYGRGRAR